MHFSFRELWVVKSIALPGALFQIVVATLLGIGATSIWEWSLRAGLVLGLALSVASTAVLLRALETHNLIDTSNGKIAIGWIIVEDLM